ncbi:hypothetical protein C8F01DRAFT_455178 [Mycena amicta]|nr:hypothetical protein C8F01DRAFT_455178 [Mycena amicta]
MASEEATSPRLSPELELQIFTLATSDDPALIPTLVLVAHRIHTWLEPMLYRTLSFHALDNKRRGAEGALWKILESGARPADFFFKAVKNVFLFPAFRSPSPSPDDAKADADLDSWSDAELTKLLHVCTGVTNLLMLMSREDPPLWSMVSATMRPQKLVMVLPMQDESIDFTEAFFTNVSHLCLVNSSSDPQITFLLSTPSALPRLTHVALSAQTDPELLHLLLGSEGGLRVPLEALVLDGRSSLTVPDLLRDTRVVVMRANTVDDWFAAIDGDDDFWTRADAFIARKRQGEVEDSRYTL